MKKQNIATLSDGINASRNRIFKKMSRSFDLILKEMKNDLISEFFTNDEQRFLENMKKKLAITDTIPNGLENFDHNHNLIENSKKEILTDQNNNVLNEVKTDLKKKDKYKHIDFSLCKQRFADSDSSLFENDLFNIKFDIGTPRNHLIILFKNSLLRKSHMSIKDLNDDEIEYLLRLVDDFVYAINAQNEEFTLSFHTGSWASAKHFHAHLCLSTDLYLRLFNEKNLHINEMSSSKNWNMDLPSSDLKDLYIKNVINYNVSNHENSMKYKKKEIISIKSSQANKVPKISRYIIPFYNKSNMKIEYDSHIPKISINLKKNVKDKWNIESVKFETLKSLIDYSKKNGYFEKNNGSHVCLKMYQNVEGYLRISADRYYDLHPLPDSFLKNFEDMSTECSINT